MAPTLWLIMLSSSPWYRKTGVFFFSSSNLTCSNLNLKAFYPLNPTTPPSCLSSLIKVAIDKAQPYENPPTNTFLLSFYKSLVSSLMTFVTISTLSSSSSWLYLSNKSSKDFIEFLFKSLMSYHEFMTYPSFIVTALSGAVSSTTLQNWGTMLNLSSRKISTNP